MAAFPPYIHPMTPDGTPLPEAFTYPFRYEPHSLCRAAASVVQARLEEMGMQEAKMFGVLVATAGADNQHLYFMAAYSGQLNGTYKHPWFVPPVFDYLTPEGHFIKEQAEIVEMGKQIDALQADTAVLSMKKRLALLKAERDTAVAAACRRYKENKKRRELLRAHPSMTAETHDKLIRESQKEKADIQRARRLHREETATLEQAIGANDATIRALAARRRANSEQLQEWLFEQFRLLNCNGEQQSVAQIFRREGRRIIPSGTGECCAPKLLQAAYALHMNPLCMAEFWWAPQSIGTGSDTDGRSHLAFYPACHAKCRPLLSFMMQGLKVETSPAAHYGRIAAPVKVMWEDEWLAIIEKPTGMLSQPGRSDQPNLFDECLRLWPQAEGQIIVHRLDQDTSGLMVVAKTARVHHLLRKQFEAREVEKLYVALLDGELPIGTGEISLPLAADDANAPRRRVDCEHGQEAVTRYEITGHEERNGRRVTRVIFMPATGRTHQLRVHSASQLGLSAPIHGDRLYGRVSDRLCLHASTIAFTHPVTHEAMRCESAAPF